MIGSMVIDDMKDRSRRCYLIGTLFEMKPTGTRVFIINVHLPPRGGSARMDLALQMDVRERVKTILNEPLFGDLSRQAHTTIIAGDFNCSAKDANIDPWFHLGIWFGRHQ